MQFCHTVKIIERVPEGVFFVSGNIEYNIRTHQFQTLSLASAWHLIASKTKSINKQDGVARLNAHTHLSKFTQNYIPVSLYTPHKSPAFLAQFRKRVRSKTPYLLSPFDPHPFACTYVRVIFLDDHHRMLLAKKMLSSNVRNLQNARFIVLRVSANAFVKMLPFRIKKKWRTRVL